MKSQNVAIYDKKSLVAIQLPLAREPSVMVRSEGDSAILRGLWGWRAGGMAMDLQINGRCW